MAGDLTSAFDFDGGRDDTVLPPAPPAPGTLNERWYAEPPVNQTAAVQEAGTREARALPYQPDVDALLDEARGAIALRFTNEGRRSTHFIVHPYGGEFTAPLQLDVQREHLERIVLAGTAYHLVVSGPNGFAREFIGARGETVSVSSEVSGSDERLDLELSNTGSTPVTFVVGANVYAGGAERRITVRGRSARSFSVPVHKTQGWYDVTITIADVPDFRRHLAGHVETGRASISG